MKQDLIKKELWLEGIISENSEIKIENALKKVDGIEYVKASYLYSNVCLTYDTSKTNIKAITKIIYDLGINVSSKPPAKFPVLQVVPIVQKPLSTNVVKASGGYIEKVLKIDGMTCSSCEMRIENALKKLNGISQVKASFSNATVIVTYEPQIITNVKIIETIEKLDYKVCNKTNNTNTTDGKSTKASDKMTITQLLGIGIILFAGYLIINHFIGFNFIPNITQNMGYGILFVIGLITSLHCVAMCGGINLSQCVSYKFTENDTSKLSKIKPSLMYNAGRVVSYTLVGGIVGTLGSVISFSSSAKGVITILAGIFMVIMGLNMLNIFPWLRKLNPRMPKIFGNKIHNNNGRHGPFYAGLLNGLMPCGPLQAMQIYALGTGSFFAGAASMFIFSLGTVPLMFGFGAISSLLSNKFTHKMMKVSAVLVMILGVIMLNRGFNLSGFAFTSGITAKASSSASVAKIDGNSQVITTKLQSGSYTPFTVQKGIPVKWTIQADASQINGCNGTVTIPSLGISKTLQPGNNEIDFTPAAEGNILYTCSMGMISSNITVVPDLTKVTTKDVQQSISSSTGAIGGGCCGITPPKFAGGKIPTDNIEIAKITGNEQDVTVTVDSQGYTPAVIVLQKGIPAKIKFISSQLTACNSTIVFPELGGQLDLNSQKETPLITPTADFTFQCGMGMLHGYVKVVDDLSKVDLNAIKNEVASYKPASGSATGGGCCG
jgi:sulfite exporter TauE/SafE/plastocyanin domain-containing protein/copper chaperone CopZ